MSNEAALIILDYGQRTATPTARAAELKEAALATSGLIGRVASAEENATAFAVQQTIKGVLDLIERARKACKRPLIDIGRAVEEAADAMKSDLELEQLRIGKLVGDFQALEEAKRVAAENARRLEEEKLQREREAEERRIREEAWAKQRKLDEEAEKARIAEQNARNDRERREAALRQAEIDRQKALAQAQSHQQLEAVQDRTNQAAALLTPVPEPARAVGQSVVQEPVIDQIDSFKLMQARPDLVSEISFKLLEVKSAIKAGVKLPGVKWHWETKSRVRGNKEAVLELR